ncbi:MAG: glycerol-3-phosphate dehydrogenase [Sphingobium sp.]
MAHDLLIIGGGINGTAIARAAALAGQKVLLVEQGDLAQGTSSASTKLMHGGLRYLERYEFRLVRESLVERGIMLQMAPHLVRPLEFRILHDVGMRSWPILRLGLWLYDLLAWQGKLPRSRSITLNDAALRNAGGRGFSYWDARVDDARLVVANAMDAADLGATILTGTRFTHAVRRNDDWLVALETPAGRHEISANIIVNAAGPWVEQVLRNCMDSNAASNRIRLVRGSHIIVKRCFSGEHAWLFQQPDGRIIFAIPYQRDWTLIGTTDVAVDEPSNAHISAEEAEYLLAAVNRYRREPLTVAAIVSSYAGIRALYDDGAVSASTVSRDYHLDLDTAGPPMVSVFGGKITTARHLAENMLALLGLKGGGTRRRPLPGGDFTSFADLFETAKVRWPFLDANTIERMASAYGTHIDRMIGDAQTREDMGKDFGAGLYAREVDYLVTHEWANSAQDIIWRRSKLGLHMSTSQVDMLQAHIEQRQT